MSIPWPPQSIKNDFGIASVSLGVCKYHRLAPRLEAAANAGYRWIDLFDDCWAGYLEGHGLPRDKLWEATDENLRLARKLGDLVKSLGMSIVCTQPLREIEGLKDPVERRMAFDLVAKRFPFMRAFDTDLVYICANVRPNNSITSDLHMVARDLAELGDMAAAYSRMDGGPLLRIGYEGISWARRNTWASTWEAVRFANRPNVGLVIDTFHVLGVEYADIVNPEAHGRFYSTIEESIEVLCASLASMVATVPAEKIFYVQCGDAELVNPHIFSKLADSQTPSLLTWSRGHRLYPLELTHGGYMPVELVVAALIATGYQGPLCLEVFNHSLSAPGDDIPRIHAQRGMAGLKKLVQAVQELPCFWAEPTHIPKPTISRILKALRQRSIHL